MSLAQRGCERFIACIVVSGRAGLNYTESKERRLTWVFVAVEGRGQGEGSHTRARASCGSSPTSTKGRSPRLSHQLMQFWGGREEARPGLKAVRSQMSKNRVRDFVRMRKIIIALKVLTFTECLLKTRPPVLSALCSLGRFAIF